MSPLPGGKVFCSKHPGRCCPRDLTSPHRSRSLSSRTPARRIAQPGVFEVFGRVLDGPRLSLSLHLGAGPRTSVPSTPRGRRRVARGGSLPSSYQLLSVGSLPVTLARGRGTLDAPRTPTPPQNYRCKPDSQEPYRASAPTWNMPWGVGFRKMTLMQPSLRQND